MIYVFGMGGASAVLAQEVQSRLVRLGYPIAVTPTRCCCAWSPPRWTSATRC